jgi:hypothetical protein
MKITIVAFEGCMTSAVYGQAYAFAIAAYISGGRYDASWPGQSRHPWRGAGQRLRRTFDRAATARSPGQAASNVVLMPPSFNAIEQTLADETGPRRLPGVVSARLEVACLELHRRIFSPRPGS